MPDLERPVQAVSRAVANLVKVGKETINSSDDAILKQDMPASLQRVEGASRLLEEASAMLKVDPYSSPARLVVVYVFPPSRSRHFEKKTLLLFVGKN